MIDLEDCIIFRHGHDVVPKEGWVKIDLCRGEFDFQATAVVPTVAQGFIDLLLPTVERTCITRETHSSGTVWTEDWTTCCGDQRLAATALWLDDFIEQVQQGHFDLNQDDRFEVITWAREEHLRAREELAQRMFLVKQCYDLTAKENLKLMWGEGNLTLHWEEPTTTQANSR
jgi:hypothetical protein